MSETILEFDRMRFEQWMIYFKVMAEWSKPFQNASLSPPLRKGVSGEVSLASLPDEIMEEFKILISTLTPFNWVDQPYDNGQGVYKTLENKPKLMRGLALFFYLHFKILWGSHAIEHEMGLQGGGQIAFSETKSGVFLDRFAVSPERINRLIQIINEGSSFPQSALEVVSEWRHNLQKSDHSRSFIAYRWFGNSEGILPELHEEMADRPHTSLLDQI